MRKIISGIFFALSIMCITLICSFSTYANDIHLQDDCVRYELMELSTQTTFAQSTIASGTCGNNLKWTLDSTYTLTISGTGYMDD